MDLDKIVNCPFDPRHTMTQTRLLTHIAKGCDAKVAIIRIIFKFL